MINIKCLAMGFTAKTSRQETNCFIWPLQDMLTEKEGEKTS